MATKSKMAAPSSNKKNNISASFQWISIKICVHHLYIRPTGYPESNMATKSKMAAKSLMAAKSKIAAKSNMANNLGPA